jgi:tetratricopeptide (TPR) repeat protein
MRLRVVIASLLTLSAVASAQPAPAPGGAAPAPVNPNAAAAKAKVDSAAVHYSNGEFGAALADMAEAYHLDPQPDLLYSMAQLEVELGDCAGAIAHYQHYLSTSPGAKAAEASKQAIHACQDKLGIKPELPVAPAQVDTHPPPPPPVRHRPFYTDVLGDSLAGVGLVGGITGVVFYLGARSDIDASEKAATLQGHLDLVDSADRKRMIAVIAGGVGGALVVGAVVRWATHHTVERAQVAVVPTGDGWGLAALGRF